MLALTAPNVPEYAVVFHGTAMAGGTVTTLTPTHTGQEVHHQLVDSGASILVTDLALLDTAQSAVGGTGVTEIFVLGGTDDTEGATALSGLSGPPLAEHIPVDADHVVVLPYSSGTTGLSQGVMLTHRNLVANIVQTIELNGLGDDDILDAVLPFFHIYGMQIMMNCGLAAGGTVVMLPRSDLGQFLRMHQEYRITRSFLAPPIVLALARHAMVGSFDLTALRRVVSAAAPLSA